MQHRATIGYLLSKIGSWQQRTSLRKFGLPACRRILEYSMWIIVGGFCSVGVGNKLCVWGGGDRESMLKNKTEWIVISYYLYLCVFSPFLQFIFRMFSIFPTRLKHLHPDRDWTIVTINYLLLIKIIFLAHTITRFSIGQRLYMIFEWRAHCSEISWMNWRP